MKTFLTKQSREGIRQSTANDFAIWLRENRKLRTIQRKQQQIKRAKKDKK